MYPLFSCRTQWQGTRIGGGRQWLFAIIALGRAPSGQVRLTHGWHGESLIHFHQGVWGSDGTGSRRPKLHSARNRAIRQARSRGRLFAGQGQRVVLAPAIAIRTSPSEAATISRSSLGSPASGVRRGFYWLSLCAPQAPRPCRGCCRATLCAPSEVCASIR
jgi:hypothetical protein